MLFKSLLATCCVALLSALIDAGPIGMDAPPPTTTTTNPSAMASSTPVDTSIHIPSTSRPNPLHYSIGYIPLGLNSYNSMNVAPEDIDASGYTHIIVGYAPLNVNCELDLDEEEEEEEEDYLKGLIEKKSSEVFLKTLFPEEEGANHLNELVNNVKRNYPGVKVIISIGNLNFANNDDMMLIVANKERRLEFIKSAKYFMQLCDVDGIDFAWKYPSNDDRLRNQGDKENFLHFVEEMREEFPDQYTISIALPLADSYIAKGLNVELMAPYLDFITIMAYDINGLEDYERGIGMRPHAAMKDVTDILNLFLSYKNVSKEKLFLGPTFWSTPYNQADPESSDDESSVSNLMTFDEDQSVAYDGPDAISKRM